MSPYLQNALIFNLFTIFPNPMKKPILLTYALCLLLGSMASAQWSQNPGQPTRVCSVNSVQNNPTTIPDGQGGAFVFWEDNRFLTSTGGNILLYAQRFGADGTKLFADTGKLIQTKFSGIRETSSYGISQDRQGNFWVTYSARNQTYDSMVVCKYDKNTLNPIWPRPKAFIKNGPGFSPIQVLETKHIPDQDSLIVTWYVTWMGGSNVLGWNKLDHTGKPMLANNPYFTAGGGPYFMLPNPFGGFYVVQRNGNGAGTGVTARRINRKGTVVWGPQSITDGTPGLNYDLTVQADGTGGFVMMYISQSDVMATRWDSSGNAVWSPAHKPVCNHSSIQNLPEVVYHNGFWYVAFIDNRLQNSSTYMQKIDAEGNRKWNPDGRLVFTDGAYLPHPKVVLAPDGDVVVTTRSSSDGFIAQKIRPDSTLAWPGTGRVICASSADVPFYENYTLTPGPGTLFPIWQGFFSRALFIGAVDSSGNVPTEISGQQSSGTVLAYPNPCTDVVNLPLSTQSPEVQLLSIDGRAYVCPVTQTDHVSAIHLKGLKSGIYSVLVGERRIRIIVKQ